MFDLAGSQRALLRDGSRPQVWMVQPADLSAKGVGRGFSASSCRGSGAKTPNSPAAESRGRSQKEEAVPESCPDAPEESERSWPEVRSNLWSISSAPSRRKDWYRAKPSNK
eukprot:s200_g4.t1